MVNLLICSCKYYIVMIPFKQIGVKVIPPFQYFSPFKRLVRNFSLLQIPLFSSFKILTKKFLNRLGIFWEMVRKVILEIVFWGMVLIILGFIWLFDSLFLWPIELGFVNAVNHSVSLFSLLGSLISKRAQGGARVSLTLPAI